MRYALHRERQPNAAAHGRATRSPASPESLGQQLQARRRDYSTAWLAAQLDCAEASAAALSECWLPAGPPHMRLQQIHAQAAWFGVDASRLLKLLDGPESAAAAEARPAKSAARREPAAASPATPAPRREVHLGSAEGVRVVQQRQPTIVWRKPRRPVAPV